MRECHKAWWVAGGVAFPASLALFGVWVMYRTIGPEGRALMSGYFDEHRGPIVLGLVAGVAIFGGLAAWLFERYPASAVRLSRAIEVMVRTEHHRAVGDVSGGPAMRRLAGAVDGLVDQSRALQAQTKARVAAATASLEEERNRLAALMAELEQAVIACNTEGRVLLYNHVARTLFAPQGGAALAASPVGLGRSIFTVIPRDAVVHAMMRLQDAMRTGDGRAAARTATVTVSLSDERLIRIRFAAVERGAAGRLAGLILLLEDVSRQVVLSQQRFRLLQHLTESTRSGLAAIRAAVETLLEYDDMPAEQRRQFIEVAADETTKLGDGFERSLIEYADSFRTHWPLEDLRADDLLTVIAKNLREEAGIEAAIGSADPKLWLTTDSYTLTRAVGALCRSAMEQERGGFEVRVRADGAFAHLDVTWSGPPARADDVARWERLPLSSASGAEPLTVRDVLERHGGELWAFSATDASPPGVRILLRSAVPPRLAPVSVEVPPTSRPEFYDFELLRFFREPPEIEHRRLEALTYTVFDTETTGLDVDNDEIISIGALRIVNGRLLQSETFEQLVDPGRPISRGSQAIHGISDDVVRGKPPLKDALVAFHRFCEETVLVGHNIAFDLRFLQRGEAAAGVRFDHPVLDTLLLSAVIFPEGVRHSLDEVADRLGVAIVGRHTAVGDSIVTGHVFLHMISLLREQGILTFGDALRAAQETYLARVKY